MIRNSKYIIKKVIIGVLIALCLSYINSCEVNAQTYVTGANSNQALKVKIAGENWTGNNWFTLSSGQERSISLEFEFYNQNDGVNTTRPSLEEVETPTYIFATLCVASGYTANWNLATHNPNASSWFDETSFVGFSKENGNDYEKYCTTPNGRTGRISFIQFRVGKWSIEPPSYDGSKVNYKAVGTLNMRNTLDYTVYAHFYTWTLSETDVLTRVRQDKFLYDMLLQQSYVIGSIGDDVAAIKDYLQNSTGNAAIVNQLEISNQKLQQQNQYLNTITDQNSTINNSINQVNDTLTSEASPDSSKYANLSNNNANNGVINNLVTLPINLARSYLNGFNSSCTPYNLGNLLGTDLVLPCINMSSYLGVVWNVIDVIISGIFIFIFGKKCVKIFNDVTNMKNNQIDEVFD